MLFWIIVVVLIMGIVIMVVNAKSHKQFGDLYDSVAILLILLGGACLLISLGCMIENYINVNIRREPLRIQYESLKYQVENKLYENDDYSKKELIDQVMKWNADVAQAEYLESNFWIGIYNPNVYADFGPIEFK